MVETYFLLYLKPIPVPPLPPRQSEAGDRKHPVKRVLQTTSAFFEPIRRFEPKRMLLGYTFLSGDEHSPEPPSVSVMVDFQLCLVHIIILRKTGGKMCVPRPACTARASYGENKITREAGDFGRLHDDNVGCGRSVGTSNLLCGSVASQVPLHVYIRFSLSAELPS